MSFFFGSPTPASTYQTKILAVSNGFIYIGTPAPSNTFVLAAGQTVAPLAPGVPVSIAVINQHAYFADGLNGIIDLNLQTNTVITYVPAPGPAPLNPTLLCNWRGRLMANSPATGPQILYASRVSDPYDWNYSATDSSAAFTDDPASTGRIGESIIALIPYTNDYFIIGSAHSMFMYQGDPAAGGTNIIVSDDMGIVGKDAWTIHPDGTLYYIATGGLFSVKPIWEFYRPPENMTAEKYNQFFANLSPGTQTIILVYDADRHYLHMFVTPRNSAIQGTHILWDWRKKGLWPQQFPINHGPTAACLFLSDNQPNNRNVLLGGFDGFVRGFDFTYTATDDDGNENIGVDSFPISRSITLGPVAPFPGASLLTGTTIDFGEASLGAVTGGIIGRDVYTGDGTTQFFAFVNAGQFNLTVEINGIVQSPTLYQNQGSQIFFNTAPILGAIITIYGNQTQSVWNTLVTVAAGPDAYSVTEGTPHNSFSVQTPLDRRQKTYRQRLRGRWFSFTFSSSDDQTYDSFESLIAEFDNAGRQRETR